MDERLFKSAVALSIATHIAMILAAGSLPALLMRAREESRTLLVELEPPLERFKKQIVRTDQGAEAEKAADNAFLSEKTRKVQQETIAKSRPPEEEAASKKGAAQAQPQPMFQRATGALAKLGVPLFDATGPSAQRAPAAPQWRDFSKDFGSVTQEYVAGLRETETTALNTKEFVFYGYFERIRTRLDLAWQPILKDQLLRMYRSGRQLASEHDHVTRTRVILNSRGHIVRVELVEKSGVLNLDDAAVEAFNKAGPFPNPPKDLISRDGTVQIDWEFVLKT